MATIQSLVAKLDQNQTSRMPISTVIEDDMELTISHDNSSHQSLEMPKNLLHAWRY
jgi:hypothetical protein